MKVVAGLKEGAGYPAHIAANFNDVVYGELQTDSAMVEAEGTMGSHTADVILRSTGAEAKMALAGGYGKGTWRGKLLRLIGPGHGRAVGPQSSRFGGGQRGKISVARWSLPAEQGEHLEFEGSWPATRCGALCGRVARSELGQGEPLGKRSAGDRVQHRQPAVVPWCGGGLSVAGTASVVGTITAEEHSISIKQGSLSIDGGERGIHAMVDLLQRDGGKLKR